jgi:hypothetical protein
MLPDPPAWPMLSGATSKRAPWRRMRLACIVRKLRNPGYSEVRAFPPQASDADEESYADRALYHGDWQRRDRPACETSCSPPTSSVPPRGRLRAYRRHFAPAGIRLHIIELIVVNPFVYSFWPAACPRTASICQQLRELDACRAGQVAAPACSVRAWGTRP